MRRAKDVLHGEVLLLVKLPNGVGQHLHRPDTKIVRGHWGKLKRPSAAGAGGILGKQDERPCPVPVLHQWHVPWQM